jgi:hypothetical protein
MMDAQERSDDDDLQLHDRHNGKAFSTQAKAAPKKVVIDPKASQEDRTKTLSRTLTNSVSAQLLGKVNQHIINPLTGLTASTLVDHFTSDITERLKQQRKKAVQASNIGVFCNNHTNQATNNANTAQPDTGAHKPGTTPPPAETNDGTTANDNTTPPPSETNDGTTANNSPAADAFEQEVHTDNKKIHREGNIIDAAGFAAITGMAAKISENGEDKGFIGTQNKPNAIADLEYISNPNPTDNNHGHWLVRKDGKVIDTVVNNNNLCLANAFVAAMPEATKQELGIQSGEDLFAALAQHYAAHPSYTRQSALHYQTLLPQNPDVLLRGGGVWADTATGLQGIENWLNAHPALLSLMKNTGNLAAGATWLKNFTPAGIVIGLVTNYGYEQVLQLMEGRMDVAKEALTSYFKAHDKDITQEQASYLANFSMEALQAVGQVAVHQVAAKRFNAVKKGVNGAKVNVKVAKASPGVAKRQEVQERMRKPPRWKGVWRRLPRG